MRTVNIIILVLAFNLLTGCVFLPSLIIKTKDGIDSVKDSFENLEDLESNTETELDSTSYEYEKDTLNLNKAPSLVEEFDFYDVECLESSFFLDKMNVIYIGVDNPCRIFVTNVPNQHIDIETSDNIEVIEKEGGFYTLRASKPGRGYIYVIAGDYEQEYDVRIKRIPSPVARLGNKNGGEISNGEFKAHGGISAWLDNFDFDVKCKAVSYSMTRISKDGTMETIQNKGARFDENSTILKNKATSGDIFLFENIKFQCANDTTLTKGNELIFRIK